MMDYKKHNVRHQKANTRARRQLDVNDEKITTVAEKYRAARAAKLRLIGKGLWEKVWRELADTDVRTMLAEEDPVNLAQIRRDRLGVLSEGRRTTSWIWMSVGRRGAGEGLVAHDQNAVADGANELATEDDTNIQAYMQEGTPLRP